MNKFLKKDYDEFIKVLEWYVENSKFRRRNFIIENFFLNSTKLNKDEIDNNRKEILSGYEVLSAIGEANFHYAIIYRANGYEEEYYKLLKEADPLIFDGIPERKTEISNVERSYEHFTFSVALIKIHIALVTNNFEKLYAIVTRDKDAINQREALSNKWDYCTIDEMIYTMICEVEADKKIRGCWNTRWEPEIYMYYALYLYLTEKENKEEYKKLVLNNAQKLIESDRFTVEDDYLKLLDLSMHYPEVFGEILDKPHKIVKADDSLLKFNILKPLTPLSKEEIDLTKSMKKEELHLFINKPKALKKPKDFIKDYVITKHNSDIVISEKKERTKGLQLDINSDDYLQNYRELASGYNTLLLELKNKFYLDYEIGKEENYNLYLDEYKEYIEKLEDILVNIESESINPPYIKLGYRYLDFAFINSLLGKEEERVKYLEKSIIYLNGEIKEEFYEMPRDAEGTATSYLLNTYAHLRLGILDDITAAAFSCGGVEGLDDDELRDIELIEFPNMGIDEGIDFLSLIESTEEMIVIDGAYGRGTKNNKLILDIIKGIFKLNKAKNKEKAKETILKRIEKLYNSIYNFESYIELYPIYMDIKKFVETEV